MTQITLQRALTLLAVCGFLFLCGKYIFPLFSPFLLGFLLAYVAEPGVRRLSNHLRRSVAAAIGVTFSLLIILSVFLLFGGLLVRQVGRMTAFLPDLEAAAQESSRTLERFLLSLAARAPEGLRNLLTRGILSLFDNSGALLEKGISQFPRMLTGVLSHLPGGAIATGTAVLSAFLISARLPALRKLLPESFILKVLPTLRSIKSAVAGWLRAQVKLAGLTFLVCLAGFFILRIPYAPVWAAVTALVDAVPLLGSGLILVPWSLISFLQGDPVKAFGLLATFGAAFLVRSALEPKLVGKQIGLDPLATLVALYLGYQLGGFWGLVASPILAVTAMELTKLPNRDLQS